MHLKSILILLFSVTIYSQELSNIELLSLEDEGLLEYFETVRHDSLKASFVATIYLQRGRQRGDTIMMARGFDRLAQSFSPYTNIKYTDSVIALTASSKHIPCIICKGFDVSATTNKIRIYSWTNFSLH